MTETRRRVSLLTAVPVMALGLLLAGPLAGAASAQQYPPVPPPPCNVPATISVNPAAIVATRSSQVTVRATPNSIVRLFAYSRPSTTYREVRVAESGADGTTVFTVVPVTNTRLFARQDGCSPSTSVVINVATALSISAIRNGFRNYTFTGPTLPKRPGQLINLYRTTAAGEQVLVSQTTTDANGRWSITRRFVGSGLIGFFVRTQADLTNAAGVSPVRPTLIH